MNRKTLPHNDFRFSIFFSKTVWVITPASKRRRTNGLRRFQNSGLGQTSFVLVFRRFGTFSSRFPSIEKHAARRGIMDVPIGERNSLLSTVHFTSMSFPAIILVAHFIVTHGRFCCEGYCEMLFFAYWQHLLQQMWKYIKNWVRLFCIFIHIYSESLYS